MCSSSLPREILKWLQSLDLSFPVKTPKWDLANGFLIAEIFCWYYPKEIAMHSFQTGCSLQTKMANWFLLDKFFSEKQLEIPKELMLGTIHNKERAAAALIRHIYERLTKRRALTTIHHEAEPYDKDTPTDLSCADQAYQTSLPLHARATASTAVKSNFRITEQMAHPDLITNAHQAQKIISNHLENRQRERMQDPDRFGIRPTLGEQSLRRPANATSSTATISDRRGGGGGGGTADLSSARDASSEATSARRENAPPTREIDVRQHINVS